MHHAFLRYVAGLGLAFLVFWNPMAACSKKESPGPAFQEGHLLEWGPDVLSQPYEIFDPRDKELKKMSAILPEARDFNFIVNLSGILYVGSVSEAVGKKQIGWWENGDKVQVRIEGDKMLLKNPGVGILVTKIISRIPPEPESQPNG